MKYITLGEYTKKKLTNLAYFGNARIIRIVRSNPNGTIAVRLYDDTTTFERTLKNDDLIEVR